MLQDFYKTQFYLNLRCLEKVILNAESKDISSVNVFLS